MENVCVIVADGSRARLFVVGAPKGPRQRVALSQQAALVNPETKARGRNGEGRVVSERNTNRQAGPVHPIGAERGRHRLEHERRFGAQIVDEAIKLTGSWTEGVIVLVAAPRLLGLMRERLRDALRCEIRLKELARDYAGLSIPELERTLLAQRLIE